MAATYVCKLQVSCSKNDFGGTSSPEIRPIRHLISPPPMISATNLFNQPQRTCTSHPPTPITTTTTNLPLPQLLSKLDYQFISTPRTDRQANPQNLCKADKLLPLNTSQTAIFPPQSRCIARFNSGLSHRLHKNLPLYLTMLLLKPVLPTST